MDSNRVLTILFVALALAVAPVAGVAAASTGAQTVAESPAETGTTGTLAQDNISCEFPVELEDATGETVVVEEEPEEVVVLAPNMAQQMWELGAKEKVTGMPVNQFTAYLNGSEQRTNVAGEFGAPLNEEVVDLDPDLVLTGNIVGNDAIQELRNAGLTVYKHELATGIEDLTGLIDRTGQLAGECEAANEVTDEMQRKATIVRNATADVDRPTVFYDLGDEPSGPFTVNSDAFEHDVITSAGAENVAADVESQFGYPEVNPEFVIEQNPEYVITPQSLSSFPGYNETAALQNDRVIEVNSNYISQHAPRTIDVLVAIAEELHPDAMAEAREALTDDADNGTSDDEDPIVSGADDEEEEEDSDDGGPGFTGGVAVAALVALSAALLARRE
jgi:iron complex transport system substrate-binding protein